MSDSRPYDLIVFDWDGTLVDSPYKIVDCLSKAAKTTRSEFDADAARSIIGLALESAIRQLYPEKSVAEVNDFLLAYREAFFACTSQSPLFPGTIELLDWLKYDQKIDLAVATGKGRTGLDRELAEYKLKKYFAVTRCSDETASKPNPLMLEQIYDFMQIPASRALLIGDTDYDLKMAEAGKTDAVGLSSGAHDIERLSQNPHRAILPDISHLRYWLENL